MKKALEAEGHTVLFTSASQMKNVSQVIAAAKDVAQQHSRVAMMVLGFPNVGKSSLINALARLTRTKCTSSCAVGATKDNLRIFKS